MKKPKAKMKRYGIFVDGSAEPIAIVDATSAPEAHRLYARRLDAERKGKA